MNRELLEKAKEIEEAISSLEKIENANKNAISFSSCIIDNFFVSDVKLPEEMNGDIMELVRNTRCITKNNLRNYESYILRL